MRLADLHTNRQLAQATGVAVGVIGELLAGRKRRVKASTARSIAEGLGLPVETLFLPAVTPLRRRARARFPRGARSAGGTTPRRAAS